MGDSGTQFRAVLKPAATPLAEANDIKTVDLSLNPSQRSIYEAAVDHIYQSGSIDTYAFKHHWELYYVHRLDATPRARLREALHAVPFTPRNWGEGERISLQLRLRDDCTGHWHSTSLGVKAHTLKDYNRWKHELARNSPAVAERGEQYLHEAMLRTVAAETSAFADTVFENPITAHNVFLQEAMDNADTVLTKITEIDESRA